MSQQSQLDFCVADLLTWNKEKCINQWHTALPTLLSKLEDASYIEESIGLLKILCQAFLPCIPSEQLEDALFYQLSGMVCRLMDSAINKIQLNTRGALKDTSAEMKELFIECIERLLELCQCLEMCVQQVLQTPAENVQLSSIKSLPACVIYVLKKTFSHCMESTELYGDLVDQLSDPLSALFKQAHVLQMVLLNALDKLQVRGSPLEEHVVVLTAVCEGLFEVCQVVNHLDVKLTISLWKGISRLCSHHISLLRDRLEVCPFINFLCREIESAYCYLFELSNPRNQNPLGDDQMFTKSVRLLGFQMKVLVALLRDFTDYLGDCERNVLHLLIAFHKYLPPCLSSRPLSERQESEVRSHVTNASAPIISHLLSNKVFRTRVVERPAEESSESNLPILLLQLLILDVLPKQDAEVLQFWLCPVNHNDEIPSPGLLSVLFHSAKQCWVEMRVPVMLPGVMVSGKAQRYVSLYEQLVTHLCGYIGACRQQFFPQLETVLLENVLDDDPLSRLLATDCWCFLVRYSTAQLCKEQVYTLIRVHRRLREQTSKGQGSQCSQRLTCLFGRLTRFMAPSDQISLVKDFPPRSNTDLWAALNLNELHPEAGKAVKDELIPWALEVLKTASGTHSQVTQAFNLLIFIMCKPASQNQQTLHSQQNLMEVTSALETIWAHMPTSNFCEGVLGQRRLSLLLCLTKGCITYMEESSLIQILYAVDCAISLDICSAEVGLSLADFLSGLYPIKPSQHQSSSWQILPTLLQKLLCSRQPLTHYAALDTYCTLISDTAFDDLLTQGLQCCDWLRPCVDIQLNKTQNSGFDVVAYLQKQANKSNNKNSEEEPSESKRNLNLEPSSSSNEHSGDEIVMRNTERGDHSAEDVDEGEPKEKRLRLPPSHSTEDSTNGDKKHSRPPQSSLYKGILDQLASVASSLETDCSSNETPLPTWFVNSAKKRLRRISKSLNSGDWFDNLT